MSLAAFVPFVGPVLDLVRRVVPDGDERRRLEGDLLAAAGEADARLAESQASVVRLEAEGNWAQRSWRPILMFVLMGLLVWHAVAVPVLAAALGVPLEEVVGLDRVPPGLWTLLTVGMGGYIGARSVEKVLSLRR